MLVAAELVEVIPARDLHNPNVTESGPKSSDPSRPILAPLERLAVPHALSGPARGTGRILGRGSRGPGESRSV
jgi:hypothetical protein